MRPLIKIEVPVGGPFHGVAMQINRTHDAVKIYTPMIHGIADLGADTGFMRANCRRVTGPAVPDRKGRR